MLRLSIQRLLLGDIFASSEDTEADHFTVMAEVTQQTTVVIQNFNPTDPKKTQVNSFAGDLGKLLKIRMTNGSWDAYLNLETGALFHDRVCKRPMERNIPLDVFLISTR